MAKCDYPQKVLDKGTRSKTGKVYNEDVFVSCGKCYNCRMNRIRGWIFRLSKENEVSKSAYFVTLTYEYTTVPITKNGFMTLSVPTTRICEKTGKTKTVSSDLQAFFKRLRKIENNKLSYYAIGEYGGRTQRPHYHLILFNLSDIENVFKAWKLGNIHFGTVTEASIAYTLEYISKQTDTKSHNRDDREKEFSLYSKGLGKNYLTPNTIKHHKKINMTCL